MSNMIESRRIAEHLTTLAGLLEAEVIRANMLGIPTRRSLEREAREIRMLADKLWDAAMQIRLDSEKENAHLRDAALLPETVGEDMPARLALVRRG